VTGTSRVRRAGVRAAGIVAVLAVAAAAGWAAGERSGASVTVAAARPIPAVSPSVPVFVPYSPDIDYPTLTTHLDYVTSSIGVQPYLWTYVVPKGWVASSLGLNEVRWAPPGEPSGGYFLRVKLISSHLTPPQMVQQKLDALNACCTDVRVIQRQWNTVGVTYRGSTSNTQRWDIFRWVTPAGSDEAEFEMSVGGRSVDDPGLEDLMTRVSASVMKTG
jgi:hypothetical protein